jgi:ATP-dependent DNA helicase DinG
MMERIAELLRQKMGASYTLCVQGESPKSELLERFKSVDNAVLVGSMSFWEGVDMKGDALQLVVIDKLPFAQFDTPLSRARKDWLTKQGKNPFMEHQLPEMITTLRQGVGRLIRSENDFGVIVMGDNRLLQKRYGRMVWDSLPPMIRTQDFARVYSFLDDPETAI